MHYKDGTPAMLGDIVQTDAGHVGILIGGQLQNDYCSSQVVLFKSTGCQFTQPSAGYIGYLRDEKLQLVKVSGVAVEFQTAVQTRECVKIGHVDIGHG